MKEDQRRIRRMTRCWKRRHTGGYAVGGGRDSREGIPAEGGCEKGFSHQRAPRLAQTDRGSPTVHHRATEAPG